MLKSTTYP